MKNKSNILFIVQARLGSTRINKKMIRPFASTNLFEVVIKKILKSRIIPKEQFYVSIYEDELKEIADKYNINIYNRSEFSAYAEKNIKNMLEWWDKLPFKYVVMISACHPFLQTYTIDKFVRHYISNVSTGMFGVIKRKNYFWNDKGKLLNKWPDGYELLNTKAVEETYEAAHCLYASKMDDIGQGKWVGNWKNINDNWHDIVLFPIEEKEALDIDYPWQFKMLEAWYEKCKS